MRVLVAAILLLPGTAPAQESRDSETVRYLGFSEILADIARGVDGSAKPGDKAAVVWLIDNATMLQTSKHGDLLAESIPQHFGGLKTRTHHVVLVMGAEDATLACKPTEDLAVVGRSIQAVAAGKPDDRIKNCMANIRTAAKIAASTGAAKKFVVLFTQENGDNEDDLEGTLRVLRNGGVALYPICGESVFSDPYWESVVENSFHYSTAEADKYRKLKFQLKGPESGYVEFPYGWPLQMTDPAYTVPSGFGYYGLDRLATHSGGKYFLYNVDRTFFTFCQRYNCTVCSGQHKDCGGAFDITKLQVTGPEMGPRDQVRDRYSKERLFVAILNIWERLYKAGILRGAPRLKATGGRITEIKPPGGGNSMFVFGSDWRTNRGTALRGVAEIDKVVGEFGQAVADDGAAADKRILGIAEAFLVHLRVLRLNLAQLALFCDDMDKALRQKRPAGDSFAGPVMDDCTGCRSGSYSYRNVSFCHGGSSLRDVRLLGGEAEEKEKRDILDFADKIMEKHRGTPFEVLVRRAALALFAHGGD